MANNVNTNEEKKKALDAAIAKLEKDFGKGAVMKLGESGAHVAVETVPTGCLSLDLALGLGGVPKGRVIEVYGPESSGKTTVALHMIAEVQKRGGIAGFIDAEHALDPVYAKNIGVDIDELYISQPDSGDQALEIAETMVRSGAIDIIVIDSVAALVPRQEIEGDMGDSHVGLQARLMSQALRKLTPVISKSNCVVIFINQLREKVGVMFGNPETTTGGRALKFYASVRMDVRRIETLKQSGEVVELRDLFAEGSDYMGVISAEVLRQMQAQVDAGTGDYYIPGGIWSDDECFKSIAWDQNFYINDSNELVIVFDEYEVASGNMGMPKFVIPTGVLAGILNQPSLIG